MGTDDDVKDRFLMNVTKQDLVPVVFSINMYIFSKAYSIEYILSAYSSQ